MSKICVATSRVDQARFGYASSLLYEFNGDFLIFMACLNAIIFQTRKIS